jgi:hypothetical protein
MIVYRTLLVVDCGEIRAFFVHAIITAFTSGTDEIFSDGGIFLSIDITRQDYIIITQLTVHLLFPVSAGMIFVVTALSIMWIGTHVKRRDVYFY